MLIYALIYFAELCIIAVIIYTLYKLIWYIIKIILLWSHIRKMNSEHIKVKWIRRKTDFIFKNKGEVDFEVTTPDKVYSVSIVSFISTHSRWNIEKNKSSHFIEVRKYNKFFYNNYVNSGTEPEHAKEYRRESRFARNKLYINNETHDGYEYILLMYPMPKALTYSTTKLDVLASGAKYENYIVLNDKDFYYKVKNSL